VKTQKIEKMEKITEFSEILCNFQQKSSKNRSKTRERTEQKEDSDSEEDYQQLHAKSRR